LKELFGSGFPFRDLLLRTFLIFVNGERGTGNRERSIYGSHPRPVLQVRPKQRFLEVVGYPGSTEGKSPGADFLLMFKCEKLPWKEKRRAFSVKTRLLTSAG
jgi:hypothetical protein